MFCVFLVLSLVLSFLPSHGATPEVFLLIKAEAFAQNARNKLPGMTIFPFSRLFFWAANAETAESRFHGVTLLSNLQPELDFYLLGLK